MKILIVDDSFVSRKLLKVILSPFGVCDIASDGNEASEAVELSYKENTPYDLICLDVMMPEVDGHEALKIIRQYEEEIGIDIAHGIKVIMITAMDDEGSIFQAFRSGCEMYILKPIEAAKVLEAIKELGLPVEES
jgi:two-component system, chemotaxis family, chemotaxis protein CheY